MFSSGLLLALIVFLPFSMSFNVFIEFLPTSKLFLTLGAFIRFFSSVSSFMKLQLASLSKCFVTVATLVRLFSSVYTNMSD